MRLCWLASSGCIQVAYTCPLLKKPDLDTADTKNYRPILKLTAVSKLLERLVAQLLDYLSVNKLLPDRQSAYRAFRSTKTAIAGLLSNVLLALDSGDIATLALLDLFVPFDTVDHTTLLLLDVASLPVLLQVLLLYFVFFNQLARISAAGVRVLTCVCWKSQCSHEKAEHSRN